MNLELLGKYFFIEKIFVYLPTTLLLFIYCLFYRFTESFGQNYPEVSLEIINVIFFKFWIDVIQIKH